MGNGYDSWGALRLLPILFRWLKVRLEIEVLIWFHRII